MRSKIVMLFLVLATLIVGCGSSPMTQGQANATARTIVKPILADLPRLSADANNMNVSALKNDARKLSADAKIANAKFHAVNWPSFDKQKVVKTETLLADVVSCMDAVVSANGVIEMGTIITQGASCKAVSSLAP